VAIDDNQIHVRPGNIGERLSGDAHPIVRRHRNGFDVIFLHLEPVGPWHFARVPMDFDSISADMPM